VEISSNPSTHETVRQPTVLETLTKYSVDQNQTGAHWPPLWTPLPASSHGAKVRAATRIKIRAPYLTANAFKQVLSDSKYLPNGSKSLSHEPRHTRAALQERCF
jgi:hypothetical protein